MSSITSSVSPQARAARTNPSVASTRDSQARINRSTDDSRPFPTQRPLNAPAVVPEPLPYTIGPATAGDHHAIFQLLSATLSSPSRDTFLSSLDDPFYEPVQRLVARHDSRLLAHVHRSPRTIRLDALPLPVCQVSGLATLPEFRGQGLAQRLLQEIERQMAADGTVLGMLTTRIPHFFRAAGWAVCGRHSLSRARPRDLLAQMVDVVNASDSADTVHSLRVRPWRQVELPAVMRLHAAWPLATAGSVERTEAYWRWLISRKHFDQIFVAVEGPDSQELDDVHSPIVGYVVMRGHEIVELVASADHPQAARHLLARACGEAVERDLTSLVLHAPPHDPLHGLFQAAGGSHFHHESLQGEVFMVKLLDPIGFLRRLCPELHRRAEQSRLARPFELGLLLQGQKHRLVATRRSIKLLNQKLGRSYLSMNDAEFTRLLLGHVNLDEAVASGRIEASTRVAQETASMLFPQRPLWHAPLDQIDD
jgi:ribosomal protein S18 acetylase RimI-like enzyme